MNVVQNFKFVVRPISEIMGVLKKLGSPWMRPRSLFSKIFNGEILIFFCSCTRSRVIRVKNYEYTDTDTHIHPR